MALEQEQATYAANLAELLRAGREGQYVVIQGEEIAGVWPTYEDALTAGYQRYGLGPFMVKEIQAVERIHFFSRDI